MLTNIGVAPIKRTYGKYSINKIVFVSPLCMRTHCNIAIITMNNTLVLNMLTFEGNTKYIKMFKNIKKELYDILSFC